MNNETLLRSCSKLAAFLGGIVYFAQSWYYIHWLDSVLDEGAYLLKGLLFVQGVYTPFQDYGPLTNHMPLSFLIHGLIQDWFGPGLRPARYFVVLIGLLVVVGLWVLIRRFRGDWWAAAAVWVIALNPAVIKMYSVATSQVLVACMLVWVLVLVLGEDRKLWQLVVGAGLTAVILMTRINLAPVLPFVLLYIFWQHGKRAGIWATAVGVGVVAVGHALFWPGILKIWTYWLPESLTPFLNPWREPDAVRYWDPHLDFYSRALSFFHGFRFHFVALLSAALTWLFWPRRSSWKNQGDFRIVVILSGLLLVLGGMHAYASLGLNYCVFCFPIYLSFFDYLGVIILLIALPHLTRQISLVRQGAIGLLILVMLTGIGFSAFSDFKDASEEFLEQSVPRMRSLQVLPGTIELGALIENRFGATIQTQIRYVPAVAGFAIGVTILLLTVAVFSPVLRRRTPMAGSAGAVALSFTLLLGFIFSPTIALGNGFQTYDCGQAENELVDPNAADGLADTILENSSQDVIQSYETVGRYLAATIPPGSKVYWRGVLSAVPLLYLENPKLYPSQINLDYTIYLTGNDEDLERYGLWSDSLGKRWVQEADYILVAERYFKDWLEVTLLDEAKYRELSPSSSVAPCNARSFLHIFDRIP